VNGHVDDNRLAKFAKNKKSNIPRPSNVKFGHQHYRKTDTLDKIQGMILEGDEEEEEERTRVKPVMTDAIETRAEITITKRLLRIREMKALRCMIDNTL